MNSYKPVSCALYDNLEAYCVKKTKLSITFKEDNQTKILEDIFIKDLQTFQKQEFVIISNGEKIRLDMILEINQID